MPGDELDVVIVGAGFSGLCVALRLARRRGVRFTVLEQRKPTLTVGFLLGSPS
jgi:2-polyprenyl-6-methoxyphenol hydroxylase-like FAD-dependent oxidoreductase